MVEPDALDVTLVDAELLAVQAFARPLTREEIDQLLQVRPQSDGAPAR